MMKLQLMTVVAIATELVLNIRGSICKGSCPYKREVLYFPFFIDFDWSIPCFGLGFSYLNECSINFKPSLITGCQKIDRCVCPDKDYLAL
jgi:hypothetical protein